MVKSKFYNLDTDETLSSNSDYYVPSEKAIKTYVDTNIPTVNNATLTITQGGVSKGTFTANANSDVTIALDSGGGSSYTAGTGINISGNTISVATPALTNTATGDNSLTILGSSSHHDRSINIGAGSFIGNDTGISLGFESTAYNEGSISIGNGSSAGGENSIAIGNNAQTYEDYSIQLGAGDFYEAHSFYVATDENKNWKMLGNDGLIPDARISNNIARASDIPTTVSELTNDSNYQTATQVANSIAVETQNRENADIGLQSQIDAIVSSSDVFDIVGTYAELQAYDITTVPVNDIIKVLVDETHSGAATYYRCVESGGVKSWSYIGSEGAYYTKGEADSTFVPQTRTVNSKALSSNITLTASDVGALPDTTVIPTVNNPTITIQKNGNTVSTFTLNQLSNETVNLTVPTATSDLNNDSGFITSADLPTNYVTTNTAQDITARKTFFGEKAIYFKQSAAANKLGFTLYNTSNTEVGAFEYRPNTISGGALLNVNCSYSSTGWVGFRYWGTAVNIVAPKVATAGDYYIPVNITDGNTTVTAGSNGTVNISSLLPSSAVWGNIRGDLSNQTDLQNALDEKADVLKVNVADIVSTYADLQSYDTSNVIPNSIIKVITDETNGGKTSWYKWDIQGSETPFVQPVLSENGTIGGDSFACSSMNVYQSREPWYAFDGVTKINSTSSNEYHCKNVSGSWLMFYNPEPLAVTKIEIYNGNVQVVDWEFQCSDDNADWRTLASGTNTDNQAESMWSFNVSSSGFHRYYRFVGMNGSYLNYWSVLEMKITGAVSAGYGWVKVNEEGKYATETWVGNQGYLTGINSSDVTTALGYTPVNPTSLATVATSGSYNDLSNKPTIPTVNNATLTIQKNGTTVNTFTANASSNVTANITVPTNTNELTNGAGFITGISSSDVTTALGYTPANDSNVVKTSGDQTIAGDKTFTGYIKGQPANYTNHAIKLGSNGVDYMDFYEYGGIWNFYKSRSGTNTLIGKIAELTTSTNDETLVTANWVIGKGYALDSAVVKTSGNQTVGGEKTFSSQIKGFIQTYCAVNNASPDHASPYKKIAEVILTGGYQSRVVPFTYVKTNSTNNEINSCFNGEITLRVESTAGTFNAQASGIGLSFAPEFINNGKIAFYLAYKNNYPESNQVTCQIWVKVTDNYSGVAVTPLNHRTGSANWNYFTDWTWGNNLTAAAEIPNDFTVINQTLSLPYAPTPLTSNNSSRVATTAYVKSNLSDYVAKSSVYYDSTTSTLYIG